MMREVMGAMIGETKSEMMTDDMMGEMGFAVLCFLRWRKRPHGRYPPPTSRDLPRGSPGHDEVYTDPRTKETRLHHKKKTEGRKTKEGMREKQKDLMLYNRPFVLGMQVPAPTRVGHLFSRLFVSSLLTLGSAFPPPVHWVCFGLGA